MERALAASRLPPPEHLIRVNDVFIRVSQQYFANSPRLFAVVTISRSVDVPPHVWEKNSTTAPDGRKVSPRGIPVPDLR